MKVIYILQGYERKLENGDLEEVVTYEVIAKNEKEAFEKAKKHCEKSFYRISQVIEREK